MEGISLEFVSNSSDRGCEVAVIVPCHNAASYLPRALDSVLAQTYSHFRLCVVDDGSTDETAKILRRYADYVSCVRQQRAGVAAARNRGISVSKGRYIAFLDADDYWLPTKLERQIELLEQNPGFGLVCSDCETIEGGKSIGAYFLNRRVPKAGKLFELLTRECFVFTPTVVVRRACVQEVGLFNESLEVSEDFDLWLRISARWDVAVVPEVLAVREKRPEGLSLSTSPERYLENGIAALENVKLACGGLSLKQARALQKAIAQRYYVYGSYRLAAGHRLESRTKFVKAMRLWPAHWRAWIKYGLTFLSANSSRRLMQGHGHFVRTEN
jgi:glycosyltransferase involved in cell wall biosynthesis